MRCTVYIDEDSANNSGCFYNDWGSPISGLKFVIGEFVDKDQYWNANLIGDIEYKLAVL